MKSRIGYLIPQFPGQTHIFFWRERQVLTELEIDTELISTRPPLQALASHDWAETAQQQTAYLLPFQAADWPRALGQVLQAGPIGWFRCLKVVIEARDLSLLQRLKLLAIIPVAGKLAWIMKTKGLTHVHIHSCAEAANIGMFASILANLSYSLTLHGPTLEVYGVNQPQKWKHSSFAIVISQTLYDYVQRVLKGFLPQQVVVAPMGVNLTDIKRLKPYEAAIPGQPCRIFACGRLNRVKGHQDLILALAQLRQRGFDASLEIAGEDEQGGLGYRQELQQFIQAQGLADHVKLLGAVSEERIRQGLEAAHIFALASLNEGVPVAVMEAMAMELPIVITQVGGNAELVDTGVDGILVPAENPTAMADQIARVLQDPELAQRLSQSARQKVLEKFHHRRSAEAIATCLQSRTGV